jgi:hypothetical protein
MHRRATFYFRSPAIAWDANRVADAFELVPSLFVIIVVVVVIVIVGVSAGVMPFRLVGRVTSGELLSLLAVDVVFCVISLRGLVAVDVHCHLLLAVGGNCHFLARPLVAESVKRHADTTFIVSSDTTDNEQNPSNVG